MEQRKKKRTDVPRWEWNKVRWAHKLTKHSSKMIDGESVSGYEWLCWLCVEQDEWDLQVARMRLLIAAAISVMFMRCRNVAHVAVCVGDMCNMCIISLCWTALSVQRFCHRVCGQTALGSAYFFIWAVFLWEESRLKSRNTVLLDSRALNEGDALVLRVHVHVFVCVLVCLPV